MSVVTLSDVTEYEEGLLRQVPELVNNVWVTRAKDPLPAVKDYGVRLYWGEPQIPPVRHKIGPWLLETWRVNTDFVFNRNVPSKRIFSDSKGISYWQNILTKTLLNATNGGQYRKAHWELNGSPEENGDSIVLPGLYVVEVENKYGEA